MKRKLGISIAVIGLAMNACGLNDAPPPKSSTTGSDLEQALVEGVTPEASYYDKALGLAFNDILDQPAARLSEQKPQELIYLNFKGASRLTSEESFLLCQSETTVPAAQLDQTQIEDVVFYVTDYLQALGSHIQVTAQQPEPELKGRYSVLHIGGTPSVVGCDHVNIGSILVPNDVENLSRSDVGFVFSDSISDMDSLVLQIEEAAEYMLGLKAVDNSVSLVREVQAQEEIHALNQLLLELRDQDLKELNQFKAVAQKILPQNVSTKHLQEFERVVAVTLGVSASKQPSQSQNQNSNNNNNNGGLLGKLGQLFNPSSGGGQASNVISAVAVLAGHPEIAAATQILGNLTNNGSVQQTSPSSNSLGAPSSANKPQSTGLPDYSSLLYLAPAESLNDVLDSLAVHTQYIDEHYTDKIRLALRSLVVVAHAQLYRKYVAQKQVTDN